MQYWLMKSEPSCYSIDDLKRDKIGMWDDVRNYQARNFMRSMEKGDRVLFYHSSAGEGTGIVGIGEVVKTAYPDPTQFDTKSYKFDAQSDPQNPRWSSVDLRFKEKFATPLTLHELKLDPRFADMLVVRKGMRLSVQPVSLKDYTLIIKMRSATK